MFTAQSGGKQKRNYTLECDFCHMKGHTRDACYKLMKCDYCLKKGHLKENCYKLLGYPPDFKTKRKANSTVFGSDINGSTTSFLGGQQGQGYVVAPTFSQSQFNQILQLLSKATLTENAPSVHMEGNLAFGHESFVKWIIDTGATNPMTSDKSLNNVVPVADQGKVQLPNGDSTLVSHVGDCQLSEGDSIQKVL